MRPCPARLLGRDSDVGGGFCPLRGSDVAGVAGALCRDTFYILQLQLL